MVFRQAPSKAALFRRIFARKASPREAIKGNCLECMGFHEGPIRDCTATACPLWLHRPYQK